MVSKPALIVILLLAATLISAVVGYTIYHGYRAAYDALSNPVSLGEALDSIKRLEYNVTLDGTVYFIIVKNNPVNDSGVIEVYNGSMSLLALYRYLYKEDTGLVNVTYIDAKTGNETSIDVTSFQEVLHTGVQIIRLPTGEILLQPAPSLAPLLFLYGVGEKLNIDWETTSSTLANVRWTPVNYRFENKEYRGALVLIEPLALPLPANEWSQVTSISAISIVVDGHTLFPSIQVEAGGRVLSMHLQSIEFSG